MEIRDVVVDVGSRTIKLHALCGQTGKVENLHNVTWDVLSIDPSSASVAPLLKGALAQVPPGSRRVKAIGTEAMRRHPSLAAVVAEVCAEMAVEYSTISHEREAELISAAARRYGIPECFDIVNVGGGSIQIVYAGRSSALFPFGIADLNRNFRLTEAPGKRNVPGCLDWLVSQLDRSPGIMAYTGGELAYLSHFRVPLQPDGSCACKDFEDFALEIEGKDADWLERNSPFGPRWMNGAIASNCIVLALMRSGGADRFLPSDLNIAHGLLQSVCEYC